jgi:hypothetical protein
MPYFELFIIGAIGALIKDIIEDGSLKLPSLKNGNFYLGFFGGVAIGGMAGILIDGSVVTAFLAGYSGTSVIQNLILKNSSQAQAAEESVEQIIRKICMEEGVDSELALRVAKCESNLNPSAVHENAPDSIDRGLFQINSKYHPDITPSQAYDPVFSTRFFCKAFKAGNLGWWDATRTCWEKR